jgi:hypothetical protein
MNDTNIPPALPSFREKVLPAISSSIQYLPVVTVFCTSLGVMFDLGFFVNLGFGMFTLFSIAEHLLFALESGPIFLAATCFTYLFFKSSKEVGLKITGAVIPQSRAKLVGFVAYILSGLCAISGLYLDTESLVLTIGFGIIFAAPLVVELGGSTDLEHMAAFLVTSMIGVALGGYAFAQTYQEDNRTPYRIEKRDGGVLTGTLIRSGDRGLLFYDAKDREFRLLPWDAIAMVRKPSRP